MTSSNCIPLLKFLQCLKLFLPFDFPFTFNISLIEMLPVGSRYCLDAFLDSPNALPVFPTSEVELTFVDIFQVKSLTVE